MLKRKRDASSTSKQVAKQFRKASLAKVVRRVIQRSTETKVCDTYFTQSLFYNTAPAYGDLTQIAQGTADNQRVGSKIKPIGMILRYQISTDPAQSNTQPLRMIVVQDLRQTITAPPITDYLKDITGASSTGTAFLMPKNFEQAPNFKILMDVTSTYGVAVAHDNESFGVKSLIKPSAFNEVHFKGTSAALSDNSSGRIFIFFMTNHNGVMSAPLITWHARLYYKDF